ncbi:hypothetical protein SNE40_022286 [Patella caerulea]|uniref:Ubiquitin-like protease family profile domain-containing protein n=1 Tax=Patella caerulea TaxID=87958 RepID=A0AAN8G3M5_PATCE
MDMSMNQAKIERSESETVQMNLEMSDSVRLDMETPECNEVRTDFEIPGFKTFQSDMAKPKPATAATNLEIPIVETAPMSGMMVTQELGPKMFDEMLVGASTFTGDDKFDLPVKSTLVSREELPSTSQSSSVDGFIGLHQETYIKREKAKNQTGPETKLQPRQDSERGSCYASPCFNPITEKGYSDLGRVAVDDDDHAASNAERNTFSLNRFGGSEDKSRNKNHELDKDRKRKDAAEVTLETPTEMKKKRHEELEKNVRELEPFGRKEIREQVEDKETKLVELTPDMNKVIDIAIGNGPLKTVSEGFKIKITREDIQTLKGLNWLNDQVINFYLKMLMERGDGDNMARVHAFNTFFYPKLARCGHSGVRRWTKRVDVLSADFILVPVHLGVHWCLAIIDFRKKSIRYYDSMGGNNDTCLNVLKQYLIDECLDKKKQTFDLTGWSTVAVKDIPQQINGCDCGMFSCVFAEYITRGAKITFTQDDMPNFRRKMVYEIVTRKLLQ